MPVAFKLTTPFVATAPVVAEVTFSNEPVVRPVPVLAIDKPTPVVKALPSMRSIVPAVVLFAWTVNAPMLLVLV